MKPPHTWISDTPHDPAVEPPDTPTAAPPARPVTPPGHPRYATLESVPAALRQSVRQIHAQGFSPLTIAQTLDLPVAWVEIFIREQTRA